jgi:cobalt transporter subunit CbtB
LQGPGALRAVAGLRQPALAGTRARALVLLALGVLVIWGVGFAHLEALHNAAHDVRHSNAFPCH